MWPAAAAGAAEIEEQQAALAACALAQPPGVRGGEQGDGIARYRA